MNVQISLQYAYFCIRMKTKRKNNGLLLLMASSVLLLFTFQVFWLSEVYQAQKEWLEEQTDNLFIKVVRKMQDDLTEKLMAASLAEINKDSSRAFLKVKRTLKGNETPFFDPYQAIAVDTGAISTVFIRTSDSIELNWETHTTQAHQSSIVHLNAEKEPRFPRFLQRIFLSITMDDTSSHEVFKFQTDSLQMDSLVQQYQFVLNQSNITLPFVLNRLPPVAAQELDLKEMTTSKIRADVPEEHLYFASFSNTKAFLFQKIAPQILFSLFLTSLTILSFVLVFQNMKKQQRLTILKNDLISNITHELKTPITTVGVAIEALSNFNALQDPKRTKEYLEISRNELKRLTILVDKVLKTALYGEEEMELKLEELDLQQLVSEILTSMKLQFEKFAAKIQFTFSGHSFMVHCDRIHLTSVIYNLLENALKYSPVNPSIAVNLERHAGSLQLAVTDNGIGIPLEFKDKIFEKFFRVPTGDRHDIKGHGLGLNYVAKVIKRHQGDIAVESEPGKGSVFTIKLPVEHGAG